MIKNQYSSLFLDQSKDLIWAVDQHFSLVYANKAYLNLMKEVTGRERKLSEPILIEGFGDGYIEKWKAYYERGLNGEYFEIEEHFYNPNTNKAEYSQITFNPITDENDVVVSVACQSRDITSFKKLNAEAEKLLDSSLDVICQMDEHGMFTKVSAACKELWGYEKHELVGKPYIDFVIEEDTEKTNQVASDIIDGKAITTFENRYKRKDGGIAFNLWSARYDPKTQIMFCVARDAREKIRKEELLVDSENRFKSLVQEGSDLIAILDEAGIYTYVSPTSIGILGIDPEEFIGKNPFDYIHPEDAEKVLNSLTKITTESRVEVEPFRFQNKNGEWRWIETVLTNMLDNTAIRGIVANSRDITAKKHETQHLKLLETVVTNANDIILITEAEPQDEPGPRIVYVNDAFTKLTGYTKEEVIGKTPRILQGPKSDFDELDKMGKSLRKWEPYEITTINYKKNGVEFWTNFTVIPVADERGDYTNWFAIQRDVTEKKKLELSKSLTSKISALFYLEPDLSSALKKLCEEIAVVGQFSFCEVWLTDIQENLLELKAVHQQDKAATIFYGNSKLEVAFERGQGLTGKIWENNKSIVWEHKGKNQELLFRSAAAEKAGIKTIVGFPLIYHNRFVGVLQFGTKAITKNVEWIINVLEELGSFVGTEILRKKTEIELTKIFEFAPYIIATIGFDGYLKKANPYTCQLLDYTENELIQKPFSEHIHPDDMKKSLEELRELSTGIPLYNLINRHVTKSGDIRTINWNISPSLEEGLIFCIGKDITEEVKIGSLLAESNQLSRIGSWEVNLRNNSIFWSDITYEIHESSKNFKPQLSEAINFYREDFRELVTEAVNACIEKGTPIDYEAIIVTNKNNEVWIRSIGKAEMVNGKFIRIFGSIQDIHERKIIEHQKNSLLATLEKSLNEIYVFDAETLKFSYVNQGALINIGYSEQEIKKLTPLDIKPGFTATTFNQLVNPLVTKEKEKIIFFTNHKRKNGSLYPVEVHLQFVAEANNKRFLAVILDITDLKETQQLLASASKLARVGSWELVPQDNEEFKIFWDHTIKDILEIDQSFEPTIAEGINFYKEPGRTLIEAAMNNAIETGEAFDLELELVSGKGNDIWIRCIGDAQFENGKLARVYGSFQDINSRKVAELNQIELNEEKINILESIGDAFYALDGELNFTYMNSSCANLLAVKKEKIIGKNLFSEFPDLKNTLFEDELRTVQNTAEATKFEFYYTTFDTWFEESIYPTPTGISVYFVDITQRKNANAEIAKSEEKRRLIMNGALDAIISIDTTETITFWNAQAEVIFGWKAEEVMGKPLSEIIIPEPFRKYHVEGLKNYLQTGEGKALNVLLELSAIRRNREEFPIELTVIPIKQGGEEFFCAFIRDITQRKKTEAARIMAEKNYQELFDKSNDAIYVHELDTGQISEVNYRATELLGFDKMDFLEKDPSMLFTDHPEYSMEKAIGYIQKAALGKPQVFEWLAKKKDGASGWFEMTLKRTNIAGVDKILAFQRDIAERKRSEEKLIESEQKYRLLALQLQLQQVHLTNAQEVAKVGSWETDLSNLKLTWSDETYRIFGTDRESFEPTHDSFLKHVHPDDREKVDKALVDSTQATAQTQHTIEHRIVTASGEVKVVEEYWKVTFGDKGEPLLAVGSCQDITERKKAEREIKQANERFEKATEATNDVIWDWDIESGTLFRSNAIDNFFGVGTSKVLEEKGFWNDNFHKEDLAKIKSSIQMALEDPDCNRWEKEYRVLNHNKEIIFVIDRGVILRNKNGKAIRMVGAITNITEQKKQEEKLIELNQSLIEQAAELKRSNEDLEQFAFITSHDLQEPLRMISSFMDQLKRKYADRLDEKGLQYIHFATDGAKRMKQIILDLLLYSRANKPIEQNELINLNEIVAEYTQMRRKVIAEKSATITVHELPSIQTYRAPITQIFHCLLDNALKYVDENKPPIIKIGAIEKENVWQFYIKDNGIGIEQKFFNKIFIIFQRLQNRKENDGNGIGLSVAKRSIEFLGGEIWVESEVDKGSTFYFTIFKIKQLV